MRFPCRIKLDWICTLTRRKPSVFFPAGLALGFQWSRRPLRMPLLGLFLCLQSVEAHRCLIHGYNGGKKVFRIGSGEIHKCLRRLDSFLLHVFIQQLWDPTCGLLAELEVLRQDSLNRCPTQPSPLFDLVIRGSPITEDNGLMEAILATIRAVSVVALPLWEDMSRYTCDCNRDLGPKVLSSSCRISGTV